MKMIAVIKEEIKGLKLKESRWFFTRFTFPQQCGQKKDMFGVFVKFLKCVLKRHRYWKTRSCLYSMLESIDNSLVCTTNVLMKGTN